MLFQLPLPCGPRFEIIFWRYPSVAVGSHYYARQNTYMADVFLCDTNFRLTCKCRPADQKARVAIRTNDNCVSGEFFANVVIVVF